MDAVPRRRLAAFFARQGIVQALRHRDFAVYAAGTLISITGFWVMRIGIGWLAWELTHSGVWLGAVALAQAVPAALVTPFAGVIGDRMDRLVLTRLVQLVGALIAGLFAVLTYFDLIDPFILCAMAVLYGATFAVQLVARSAIGPSLVPKEDVPAAISVGSAFYGTSAFIGPAIAGILIYRFGVGATFAFNAVAFVGMYAAMSLVKLRQHEHHGGRQGGFAAEMMAGLRYAARHAGIAPIIVLAVVTAALVRSLSELIAGFSDLMYGLGPAGLATLMSSFGLGALVGALWIANRNTVRGTTTLMLVGAVSSAVLTMVLTLTPHFGAATVLMCLIGFTGACWQNSAQILIQHAVEGSMRARVMSLFTYNFGSAPALGAMIIGGLSAWLSLAQAISAGAGATLLVLVWVIARRTAIRDSAEATPA